MSELWALVNSGHPAWDLTTYPDGQLRSMLATLNEVRAQGIAVGIETWNRLLDAEQEIERRISMPKKRKGRGGKRC